MCICSIFWPALALADDLELVLQAGHARSVNDTLWLDDNHLLSGSTDGSIKLWDVGEQRVKRTLWPPMEQTRKAAWGRSVKQLAASDEGVWALYQSGHLRLWSPMDGSLLRTVALPEGYSGSEVRMTMDRDKTVYIYGEEEEVLRFADGKFTPIPTPRLDLLAINSSDQIAASTPDGLLFGTLSRQEKLPKTFTNRWGVDDILLSDDGRTLYVATSVNWLEIWDLTTQSLTRRVPVNANAVAEESLKSQAYSGQDLGFRLAMLDGEVLAATEGGEVTSIDPGTGVVKKLLNFEEYGLSTARPSPSGHALACGFADNGKPAVPVALKTATGWDIQWMGGTGLNFTELQAKDDTLFLSAGSNFVLSYDLATGQPSHTYRTGYFPSIFAGRESLYAGGNDGVLHAFNTETGAQLWEKALTRSGAQFDRGIVAIAQSPDGRQLAVSILDQRPSLQLLDARTGELIRDIPVDKRVFSLTYSKDGRKLFIADYDKVSLFDLGYKKLIHSWKKPYSGTEHFVSLLNHPTRDALLGLTDKANLVEFDPNELDVEPTVKQIFDVDSAFSMKESGSNLIVAGDLGAYLMDTDGKVLKSYGHHLTTTADALALDNVVLTSGWDSRVLVWDKSSTDQLATLLSLDQGRNWLFISSDFHFDGTEAAQNLIEWRWNGELYELARFFEKFYQPGLLARTINQTKEASVAPGPALGDRPPDVKILEPKRLADGRYEIAVEAEGGIPKNADVRLYHNGHRVAGSPPYTIKPVPGENRLRVSAYNADRTVEGEPDRLTFVSQGDSAKQTLHIFAAAINEYPNRLDFAVQDAKSFVDAFEPGLYDKVDKVTLYDKAADKESIVKALAEIKCEPQDTLLVFLAGHGTIIDNRFHFIPYGGDGKAGSEALSSVELGKLLAQLPATRQVLFLDTCHAGASAKDLAELLVEKETPLIASAQGSTLIKDQQVLARQAGTFLVAGSTPNATAAEVPELGHGLFTYAVLNGLQGELGKDQEVTVNELLTYLSDRVPELSLKFRGSREGIWQFSAGQDFPIARPKGGSQ
ncbi:MAG: caspase family protein [Candidatus Eremiobacteraeota bacterium]|nr:caspase family protein [Candidatus Eremiobacteraeota bacterium]